MQDVADHVFMFRRLPESQRDPAASTVIQLFINAVSQSSSCIPAACRSQMHAMLQTWLVLRQDSGVVDSEIALLLSTLQQDRGPMTGLHLMWLHRMQH
jgi:hypothetical protein